jgi:ubiquitin C-terminal hydrolase
MASHPYIFHSSKPYSTTECDQKDNFLAHGLHNFDVTGYFPFVLKCVLFDVALN